MNGDKIHGATPIISVSSLWKVFGKKPQTALEKHYISQTRADIQEELGLVVALRNVSFEVYPGETFVVMGLSGSGKSTTLASLIQKISNEYNSHIITIEDPIEYLYEHSESMVNQREEGIDTASYTSGLRSALRHDPDVVAIGEL